MNIGQSRPQSTQALWPAVGRQERLWGTGRTMQPVTGQPIKKKVSPGDQPLAKDPEDSGYEIVRFEGVAKIEPRLLVKFRPTSFQHLDHPLSLRLYI